MAITETPSGREAGTLKNLLLLLFEQLQRESVVYCVLRNYEEIPERVGNDIDMLVLAKDLSRFEICFVDAAMHLGWTLLKKLKRFGYRSYWLRCDSSGRFVHFDVWSKITWRGLRWADEKAILMKRNGREQFYIPNKADEACISLMKDLIQQGMVKEQYRASIKSIAVEDSDTFAESLRWGFGKSSAVALSAMAGGGEWEKVTAMKRRIRRDVVMRSLLRNPLEGVVGVLAFLLGHMRSMLARRGGIFVAFVGPDGSGKSTVANGLMESLARLFPERRYYHGHFGIIPPLRFFLNLARRLAGLKPLPAAPSGPDAIQIGPAHGRIRAIIYVLYYSVDYWLGHFIVRRALGKGQLLVSDRYFYDYFLAGQFENLPRWLLGPLLAVLPQPDILVYLCNKPEVVHGRKPELTIEQIERQSSVCQSMVDNLPYAISIFTDRPATDIVEELSLNIFGIMRKRVKK